MQLKDPVIFVNFLEHFVQVRFARVREKIATYVETFDNVLSSSDDEIDAFIKEVHSSNWARASNALVSFNVVLGLKRILFELKNKEMCDALPSAFVLDNLDNIQISSVIGRCKSYAN